MGTFRISVDDRKDISHRIGQFADAKNYALCVSTAGNHIQVLRGEVDQEKYKNKYAVDAREISRIPRAREFKSSRTFRINRAGIKSCLDKTKVRVNWYSEFFCTSECCILVFKTHVVYGASNPINNSIP